MQSTVKHVQPHENASWLACHQKRSSSKIASWCIAWNSLTLQLMFGFVLCCRMPLVSRSPSFELFTPRALNVVDFLYLRFIYTSAKGYLPWIPYVAHQEIFWYPLWWYSSQWADYNKVYPYWKKCTPTGRSTPVLENLSFHGESFHSLLEEYSLCKYLLCCTK